MNELDCKINVNKFKGLYKSVYKYYTKILNEIIINELNYSVSKLDIKYL